MSQRDCLVFRHVLVLVLDHKFWEFGVRGI